MYRLEYVTTGEDRDMRLEKILTRRMGMSSGSVRSLKFRNALLLDGEPAHTDRKVLPGQRVTAVFGDAENGLPEKIVPLDIPVTIPWQDEDLAVIDKPAPLASLRSGAEDGFTLENALFSAWGCPENFVYRPVNRLDKGTSGLMLVAKNAYAQQRMQKMLHTDLFIRRYMALTDGIPPEKKGRIDLNILTREDSVRRVIDPAGKPSVTDYEVIRETNGHALLLLTLHTGRTHQIRVHLSASGFPVTGDYLYGREHRLFPGRFALHSCYLSFVHPLTGKAMTFESRPPFAEWTERL